MLKKLTFGFLVAFLGLVAFSVTSARAYDGSYSDHNNYNNGGYGGGYTSFFMLPSTDYMKNALMQNFSYQNDINFADHTAINYASSQASESFNQSYYNNHGGNNNGGTSWMGISPLFNWLANLFNMQGNLSFSF